jgi:hypothetical protein
MKSKIIHNQLETILKNVRKEEVLIKFLTTSNIIQRVKYLKFSENIANLV